MNNKIVKTLKLSEIEYYTKHLEIVNSMLPVKLTPKEIEVLGNFMSLKGDIAEADRFGTSSRKIVKDRMKLQDGGLGNYIKSLKEKGFIVSKEDKMDILPFLKVNEPTQFYMFKIEKE